MTVEVTPRGLKVGDAELPLVMGAMHYWRLDHLLWDDILEKVKGMGFNMIETYIPWSVHELSPGRFDFGDQDPRKDIGGFLELCAKKNVMVLARPGPHINSELTYFGYPERVLADPECQSVSAQNTPVILPVPPRAFPVPSYASGKFYDEVATWFDAICPIIGKHKYPAGSVIAAQADNEMSLFFRTNAYDHDFSVGAVRLFGQFLEKRYGDIGALNKVYRSQYRDFGDVPMLYRFDARGKEDIPKYMDWAAYKEYYILYGIERITKMLKERGLTGIPITHNYPDQAQKCPFNIAATERILDIQGFDMYPQAKQYNLLKRGCLTSAAQSRLPFIPEFSSGCWIYMPPITFEDQRFTTLVAWMHGVKGISFYMLVERERWYGSPIARDGRIRQPNYDYYKKLNGIIKAKNLPALTRVNDTLLMNVRSYQYLDSASTLLEPLTTLFFREMAGGAAMECSENPLGFAEPIPIAAEAWEKKWYNALRLAQYPFLIGDTEMSVETLTPYKMLIAPTFEFLGRAEQSKLAQFAEQGGILAIGPKIPEFDETMNPCATLKNKLEGDGERLGNTPDSKVYRLGKGRVAVFESLPEDDMGMETAVDALATMASLKRHFPSLEPHVETSFHRNADNSGAGVLYVANATDKPHNASIKLDGPRKLTDLWSGREFSGDKLVEFEIEPYTVRMLEVR